MKLGGGVPFPVSVFHQAGCFLRLPCCLLLLQWHPSVDRWHLHNNCLVVYDGHSQTNGKLCVCVCVCESGVGRKGGRSHQGS